MEKFEQMVACHGGSLEEGLPVAPHQTPLLSPQSGYIEQVDAEAIGRATLLLGAGRAKTSDQIDHAVGLSDLKKIGESIKGGEPLCVIHSNGKENHEEVMKLLNSAFKFSSAPVEAPPLIIEIIQT